MKSVRTSGKNKVLGILGGMGPLATADFYREVISLTPARHDQDHIPVIIFSNPEIPDRTESISKGHHKALPYLIEGATFLEHAGADFIIIPCNTAHYYINDLREGIRIPILSMIEETVAVLTRQQHIARRVAILGSDGTRATNLYGQLLQQAGIAYVYPDATHQALVMQAIYEVKAGVPPEESARLLEQVGQHMVTRGADILLLGCTELPILAESCTWSIPILNPTQILAEAVVAYAQKSFSHR